MSGNPNPQHNPTDGLGVAAYVTVLGNNSGPSKITKVGSQVALSPGNAVGGNQYACTLSVAGTAAGLAQTEQLAVLVVDVKGNTYSAVNTPTYKCYGTPQNSGWYNPKPYSDTTSTSPNYNANVANVSSSGLITATAPGQVIVEVQFPTFDNVMTPETDHDTGNPTQMIYAQIIVTVVP